GIVTMAPVLPAPTPEANYEKILAAAEPLYAMGKAVVGLGGEHSVTAGLVEAARRAHPGLTVLQLDAHADTRESYGGTPYSHASVMARVREQCGIVQVGIRSMDAAEAPGIRRSRIHYAHEIGDIAALAEAVLERLGDHVYVTIDLDVLDPSEMPSTGTPEPGGLRYRQLVELLREVCRWRTVVGFDVVELAPVEHDRAPDFLAARLAYQVMAYMTAFADG
ncbi:MAG: arginase family protein, partial [Candidatus Krumholzibacteriia bacterium]